MGTLGTAEDGVAQPWPGNGSKKRLASLKFARRKALKRRKILKLAAGRCRFCGEADPALLDAHRIVPGTAGGRYCLGNVVVACANCHRRCHSGEIRIDRYYQSSSGLWVLHYWLGDQEVWD